MSKEDELANRIIERFKSTVAETRDHFDETEHWSGEINTTILPEVHYNHYGKRGSVDLYLEKENTELYTDARVIEIKSESAVQEVTGANEIIRQFNKMRKYFFKGSEHKMPRKINFHLIFTATKNNIRHIHDNIEMYCSSCEQSLIDEESIRCNRTVAIKPIEKDTWAKFCENDRCLAGKPDFNEYIKTRHDYMYEEFGDLFDEISRSNK